MSWTALIPLNAPAERKSRLAAALDAPQREALAEELYRHVLGAVQAANIFETILTLSPSDAPRDVHAKPALQRASTLNAEIARARSLLSGPLLVINADLPLLAPPDLIAFVAAAERTGCALASDRHGTGTNAVALLAGVPFQYAFGPSSLATHSRSAPEAEVVRRTGLACDLDTPDDIRHLFDLREPLPGPVERLLRAAGCGRPR